METEKRMPSVDSPSISQAKPSDPKTVYFSLEASFPDASDPPCEGIGRLTFFLICLPCLVAGSLIAKEMALGEGLFRAAACVVILITLLLVHASRLRNIGTSPYWSLLLFVPGIGGLLTYWCQCGQEGYAYTKKLDKAGKAIAWSPIGVILLGVVLLLAVRSPAPSQRGKSNESAPFGIRSLNPGTQTVQAKPVRQSDGTYLINGARYVYDRQRGGYVLQEAVAN